MKKIISIGIFAALLAILFAACNDSTSTGKKESSGDVTKSVDEKTAQPLAADETYTCTMHNEVMSDHPGKCPKCGMKLVKQKMTPEQEKMMKEGTYVKPNEQ